jgi:YbbR domain-containing protein
MTFLLGNLRLKLLAVAAATALWATVAYTENPTAERTFQINGSQIQHTAVPVGLVLIGDLPPVSVTVVGPADALRTFDPNASLRLSANFSGLHQGTQSVPVQIVDTDNSTHLRAQPASIAVTVDQLATVTATVTLDQQGSVPVGFHLVSAVIDPKQVSVAGPKSLLANIDAYVVITLDGHQSFFQDTPIVSVRDQKKKLVPGLLISPATVTVKVTIQADAVTEAKVVGWTLTGQPAPGYRVSNVTVTPLEVSVTGLAATLDTIQQMPTDPVDISNATADVVKTVAVRLPAGVQDVSPKSVQVHVFIVKIPQPSP